MSHPISNIPRKFWRRAPPPWQIKLIGQLIGFIRLIKTVAVVFSVAACELENYKSRNDFN